MSQWRNHSGPLISHLVVRPGSAAQLLLVAASCPIGLVNGVVSGNQDAQPATRGAMGSRCRLSSRTDIVHPPRLN
jgi:hypothetical protein